VSPAPSDEVEVSAIRPMNLHTLRESKGSKGGKRREAECTMHMCDGPLGTSEGTAMAVWGGGVVISPLAVAGGWLAGHVCENGLGVPLFFLMAFRQQATPCSELLPHPPGGRACT
jgi:hypothetical protein